VDESATGSVNFLVPGSLLGSRAMHLRAPSIDQGVHAFVWSVVFFLYMWLGALAIEVPGGVAFIVSLVAAAAIFLFVRLRGSDS
jgi:hypothetical protein